MSWTRIWRPSSHRYTAGLSAHPCTPAENGSSLPTSSYRPPWHCPSWRCCCRCEGGGTGFKKSKVPQADRSQTVHVSRKPFVSKGLWQERNHILPFHIQHHVASGQHGLGDPFGRQMHQGITCSFHLYCRGACRHCSDIWAVFHGAGNLKQGHGIDSAGPGWAGVSSGSAGEPLAALVSFGVAPAMLLYNILLVWSQSWWIPYVSLIIPVMGAFVG